MSTLSELCITMENLRKLNLPERLKQEAAKLEEDLICTEILPTLTEKIELTLTQVQRELVLTNIDDFKLLDLFSHSMYEGDSFAPAVKSRLDFVESLIDSIKALKDRINYLDHIQYLTEQKEFLEREYTFELKRGHKHRLYDL